MRKGKTLRVTILLKGGRPGEPATINIFGGTDTQDRESVGVVCYQVATYEPSVGLTIKATRDGTPVIIVSSPEDRFTSTQLN